MTDTRLQLGEVVAASPSSRAAFSGRAARKSAVHSGFSASSSRRFGRRRNRVAMAISLFDSRELGTKAEVNTAYEGQRTYIGPGDIQSIRPIRIDSWVSIGRPQQAEHALTLPDFLPANVVDVLERITRSITDREQVDGHEYQRENSFCSDARRKVAYARAQGWLPRRIRFQIPLDQRGRGAEGIVPGNLAADRRTATKTGSSVGTEGVGCAITTGGCV